MVLTVLDFALGYGKLGWRVFPVWPGEKRPIYAGWPSGATVEPELIQRYFRKDPFPNIGVVCGEAFDAWDVEAEHLPALTAYMTEHKVWLPEGPLASTGRGGMHLLTRPTGVNGTRQLHLDGTHIGELKSTGGFIVVAPSITVAQYRWVWAPRDMALPVLEPDHWLRSLVRQPQAPAKVVMWRNASLAPASDIEPLVKAVRGSVEGDRNAILHWAANRAYDDGITQQFATTALMDAFMVVSRSDESRYEREAEARATIASAYHR